VDGPHFVNGRLSIRAGAELVVEPCVEVRLGPGAFIDVGAPNMGEKATLSARGEPTRPIVFTRAGEAAWSSIAVFAPATAALAHVTLRGGGSDVEREASTIYVAGTGDLPSAAPLFVDHVTVESSRGHGIVLAKAAAFAPSSAALQVHASGDDASPQPLVIGQHALGSIPSGDLRGNRRDEVLVREDLASGFLGLQVDRTMQALSVPYRIGTSDREPMRIGSSSGAGFATLTIDAGVTMRFSAGVGLRVLASPDRALGAIRALGTQEAPVTFTSAVDTPRPGDWPGLYFESPLAASNLVQSSIIAFAGGYCSCSLVSCSPVRVYDAAIVFDGAAPPTPFVRNTTIRDSAGHGVLRSWHDRADVDFLATNTFERIAGCKQTSPTFRDVVCPDVSYACEGDAR